MCEVFMQHRKLIPHKTERGQAFMELAISLVFLLVLLTVLVDLGWAFYTMIAMRDTVQEAAVYGSICPDTADDTKIVARLRMSASAPLDINTINSNDIDIQYVEVNGTSGIQRGDSIQITLNYQHKIVVPLVATFIGKDTYPLHVTVADTLLQNNDSKCD